MVPVQQSRCDKSTDNFQQSLSFDMLKITINEPALGNKRQLIPDYFFCSRKLIPKIKQCLPHAINWQNSPEPYNNPKDKWKKPLFQFSKIEPKINCFQNMKLWIHGIKDDKNVRLGSQTTVHNRPDVVLNNNSNSLRATFKNCPIWKVKNSK